MTFRTEWTVGLPLFHNISDQENIILILQPLFEEANRTRRTLALMAQKLGDAGLGAAIPDVPGMGEHPTDAASATVTQVNRELSTLVETLGRDGSSIITAGWRGGCLFDGILGTNAAWRFAPEAGDRMVRTMLRTEMPDESDGGCAFVLGQSVSGAFLDELAATALPEHDQLRTIRLATDRAEADRHIEASPLWRHAEPGEDPALAELLADDLIQWVQTCAAS